MSTATFNDQSSLFESAARSGDSRQPDRPATQPQTAVRKQTVSKGRLWTMIWTSYPSGQPLRWDDGQWLVAPF
jgi:hypothetical protein